MMDKCQRVEVGFFAPLHGHSTDQNRIISNVKTVDIMADNDGGGSNAALASGVFNIALTTQTGDEVAVGDRS